MERRASPPPVEHPTLGERLGRRKGVGENDARHRIDCLARSLALEEEDAMGLPCFGPYIHDEPFPKGFSLPRDMPKYNGSMKPEDWLVDYSMAVNIANDNKRVAVKYVLLMLQGTARSWLNSLKPYSVNSWVDFTKVFIRNFTSTYNRPPKPRQLSLCIQGPDESTHDYLTRWAKLRNSCEGVHEVQAIEYFTSGCQEANLLKHRLLCDEPATLDELLIIGDKYATTDSFMKSELRVDASGKVPLRLLGRRLLTTVGGNSRTSTSARPRSRLPLAGRWGQSKTSSLKDNPAPSARRATSLLAYLPSPTSRPSMLPTNSTAARSRPITPPGSATSSPESPRAKDCFPLCLLARCLLLPNSRRPVQQLAMFKMTTPKSMEPTSCSPVWLATGLATVSNTER